jgi:hypothetical protein
MSRQLQTESSEKAKQRITYRQSRPDFAPSFHEGLHPILQLQRTIGNRRVAQLIHAKRLTQQGKILGLQRKLTVGAAGDQYEQEADRVADQVMRMPDPALARSSIDPTLTRALSLQPQCQGCEDEEELQRQPQDPQTETPSSGLDLVAATLSESGQPLDANTRAFFEPRFGTDFSAVRIHNDTNAAASARAVNALAYTVGHNVVFNSGQYTPQSDSGKRLLAHELTHVVQQGTDGTDTRQVVQRQKGEDFIEVDLVPVSPEGRKEAKRLGIDLPTVSDQVWRLIGGVADNAGKMLSDMEKKKIEELFKKTTMALGTPLASVTGPKVLLHDTSAPVGAAKIKSEKDKGRGPLGAGVAAWVPVAGDATIARPNLFESKRPSTSEFEKGIDIIKQADREQAVKDIWAVTKSAEKDPALDGALAGTRLTAPEITSVKNGATGFLSGTIADKDLPDGSKSAGTWAMGDLCSKAARAGTAAVALDKKDADFDAGCKKLAVYFPAREARVGSIVPIEIVQVGVIDPKKNLNTCDPKNPNVKPMPSPPYSDNQYLNIALVYLNAAYVSGRFPEATTHFVVDAFERGHCDPRCFDLQKLYDTIAVLLGHGKGSTYGVKPSYGLTWGTNTIWWDNTICGGSPST